MHFVNYKMVVHIIMNKDFIFVLVIIFLSLFNSYKTRELMWWFDIRICKFTHTCLF